ncbi:hypothetical protein SLEP1_g36097 [Rubroshorea leprosula]|uniref:Reverse transcriptase n=1 Tax=Rubroshorea leprosula TaxID=152421 RepID=A0AAV5KQN2_9ROSI|nr:hypothetical protein SLEP1_g36097 [Rubroshorea leprosula]
MANSNVLSLTFRSPQEKDQLDRSVKRIKNVNLIAIAPSREEHMAEAAANPQSYRDKLIYDGSFETLDEDLSFDAIPEYLDEDSDIDDDPDDPTPIILFSKEEKRRMREPWKNALIVKTFGKPVGYNFLYGSLKAQWKPAGKWDCIDLGYDFFLVRFQVHEDLSKVINGGPWFIGTNYLTIRPWEPNFKPENATFSHTVVWAQLPGLSAEYYDKISLQRIGNEIETLLRVDAHIAHHTRGQYGRVCVRIDLNKPLVKLLRLGKIRQKVVYEGIRGLCFACGRIGHRKEVCTFQSRPSATASVINLDLQNQANFNEDAEINVTGCHKPEASTSTEGAGGIQSASNNHVPNYTAEPRHIRENQFDEFVKVGRTNGTPAGAFNVKTQFKPAKQTVLKSTVTNSTSSHMDTGPKRDSISRSSAPSGKEIGASPKTTNEDFGTSGNVGQSNNPTKAFIPTETISSLMSWPCKLFSNAPASLEAALLTVKERIKNLESSSNFTSAPSISSILPKSSSDIRNERSSSSFTNSPAQPQFESPTSQQQQCDFIEGSLRAVIIKGGENTPDMEGEGSIQGLAQSSPNSQIHRSFFFSKLSASFEGRFDSYGRSMQYSKARVHYRRSKHRRDKGPYPTSEISSPSMAGTSPNLRYDGQDGDNPCYHQVLNIAGDGGDGLRMPDASVSLFGGQNDAVAQGNSGIVMLSWNCRGAAKMEFNRRMRNLKNQHSPSIMLILETKLSGQDARKAVAECGYPCSHVVDSDGKAGGLWLLWDDNEVCVDVVTSTFQAIHAIVQKRILNARLEGIHHSLSRNPSSFLTSLEKELTLEYVKVLKLEEDLWFMKSRSNWIVDGDRNSKFFHLSTIKHRNHNRIFCLRTSEEDWICDQQAIVDLIRNHFMHLFTSSLDFSYHDSFSNLGVGISESHDLSFLDNPPSDEEIHNALFGLKLFKAPGPDGLHPGFFQKMWDSVRSILCSDIHNTFSSASLLANWNECLITLIPKTKATETVQQFRPIGLCNATYKIISKIIVNKMKPALDDLISPCQASFVPGRNGIDNVLILQELVHSFSKRKGRVGDMVVKLDLEKAYDRLEWSFIREALTFFKFPPKFISLVMSCVSSSSISILVNGNKTDAFLPSRGIRQGDPISPYLFILCMEYLSIKLSNDMAEGKWKGSKAGKRGPTLSHMFFADDLVFVGKATLTNAQYLKDTLDFFCSRSGQMVNNAKSKILFSKNVDQITRDNISQSLGYQQTNELGKATLVSSVLASIPNYFMQVMWLPSSVHKEIDKISRNFLWGSVVDQRKIHLVDWDTICKPKSHGGLGIRSARNANTVAMSKLNWRIHTEKDKMWREVLVKKYNINDLRFAPSSSASPVLKNLSKGTPLFTSGIKWVPRNGLSIHFWTDHWVGKASLDSILFGPFDRNTSKILLMDVFQEGVLDFDTIGYHIPQELSMQILAVPMLNYHSDSDIFSWKEESNGIFSSSSAHKILTSKDCQVNDNWNWKWIWKTPTLPKIQMFLWLLAHGKIKTLEYLHHLSIVDNPTCMICRRQTESIDHVFRDCPHAVAVFNKLSHAFANSHNAMNFRH